MNEALFFILGMVIFYVFVGALKFAEKNKERKVENKIIRLSEAIAALERGEEVEYNDRFGNWFRLVKGSENPLHIFFDCEFRIKPKPMEIWVNVYPSGPIIHKTKNEAENSAYLNVVRVAVKFREVVGEEGPCQRI